MFIKILSFIGIAITAFFLFRRSAGLSPAAARKDGAPQTAGARRGAVEDLVPCPQCGAFRPANGVCDCQRAPTL